MKKDPSVLGLGETETVALCDTIAKAVADNFKDNLNSFK